MVTLQRTSSLGRDVPIRTGRHGPISGDHRNGAVHHGQTRRMARKEFGFEYPMARYCWRNQNDARSCARDVMHSRPSLACANTLHILGVVFRRRLIGESHLEVPSPYTSAVSMRLAIRRKRDGGSMSPDFSEADQPLEENSGEALRSRARYRIPSWQICPPFARCTQCPVSEACFWLNASTG